MKKGILTPIDIESISAFAAFKSDSPEFTPSYLHPKHFSPDGTPQLPNTYEQSHMKYAFGVLLSIVFLFSTDACILNGEKENVEKLLGHFNPSDLSVCSNSKGFKEAFDGFFKKAEKMIRDENFRDRFDQLKKERDILKKICRLLSS